MRASARTHASPLNPTATAAILMGQYLLARIVNIGLTALLFMLLFLLIAILPTILPSTIVILASLISIASGMMFYLTQKIKKQALALITST